jgi:hypothetical protein
MVKDLRPGEEEILTLVHSIELDQINFEEGSDLG